VKAGAKDRRPYNHYSLLRSMEDIFGIKRGGTDGKGHLGFAGVAGVKSFGSDAFGGCHKSRRGSQVPKPPSNGPRTGANPSSPVTQSAAVLPMTGGLPVAGVAAGLMALALFARPLIVNRRRR
jgi:hypothetical protein